MTVHDKFLNKIVILYKVYIVQVYIFVHNSLISLKICCFIHILFLKLRKEEKIRFAPGRREKCSFPPDILQGRVYYSLPHKMERYFARCRWMQLWLMIRFHVTYELRLWFSFWRLTPCWLLGARSPSHSAVVEISIGEECAGN